MVLGKITRFFDANEKELGRLKRIVEKINSLESGLKRFSWEELKEKTSEFKLRHERGEGLDGLLPEAFAVVREAINREIGERAFDVQLMAAVVLHEGKVAEQKTGEGKTHSAAFAMYLKALVGRGVHYVSVNDYLARRDAGWYARALYKLGLSIGVLATSEESYLLDLDYIDAQQEDDVRLRHLRSASKREAYAADITFGVNSEFGFDFLRDNMARRFGDIVQRGHHYAIIDEVDSILIDEARTPHIISMPDMEATEKYVEYARLADKLNPELDFILDEKLRTAHLTEHGLAKVEKMLGVGNLYEKSFDSVYHIEAALKARTLYKKDRDYVVRDREVIIVDEFTGRLMPGRRWSEGIHQAVEAKEGAVIQQESKTLATISLQNYFRKYEKLAGMTGTAATEAEELDKIYGLKVVTVPTNQPMIRDDLDDVVYRSQRAKYAAIVRAIEGKYKIGQPVLVGTTSIDKNQIISHFLKKRGIVHEVLNAKNHEREAKIIADAGRVKSVTVATNMAGRGVDIVLGGQKPPAEIPKREWEEKHKEVLKLGGLHVIGTERHESRRIDNQLRGRAGRQGDPGGSQFFVSLDDDIMRLFGGERIAGLMTRFNLPEDQPLTHKMVSKSIEGAQGKVEGFYFDMRKRQVEYDDVLNKQRDIIYDLRKQILKEKDLKETILEKMERELKTLMRAKIAAGVTREEGEKILVEVRALMPIDNQELGLKELTNNPEKWEEALVKRAREEYQEREKEMGGEVTRELERWVYLTTIDGLWMEHLTTLRDLETGVKLRAYAQKDPLVEYKQEAYQMFEKLIGQIDFQVVRKIFRTRVAPREAVSGFAGQPSVDWRRLQTNLKTLQAGVSGPKNENLVEELAAAQPTVPRREREQKTGKKIGRNDRCWCGSGKKFKKCHGR